jgi:hypothetical protein
MSEGAENAMHGRERKAQERTALRLNPRRRLLTVEEAESIYPPADEFVNVLDQSISSNIFADAFTKCIQAAVEPGGSLYIDKYRPDFRITNIDPGLLDIIAPATVRIQIPRRPSE